MKIHQMDVDTAFLNGELDHEIFMCQPQGYNRRGSKGEKLYCKLLKSIYGLKNSLRIWYKVLNDFLKSIGFERCWKEYCIYIRKGDNKDDWVIIVVYVDDLSILAHTKEKMDEIKRELSGRFKMKDLGEIDYILKMQVTRDRKSKTLTIDQERYILDRLTKYDMEECRVEATPQLSTEELQP